MFVGIFHVCVEKGGRCPGGGVIYVRVPPPKELSFHRRRCSSMFKDSFCFSNPTLRFCCVYAWVAHCVLSLKGWWGCLLESLVFLLKSGYASGCDIYLKFCQFSWQYRGVGCPGIWLWVKRGLFYECCYYIAVTNFADHECTVFSHYIYDSTYSRCDVGFPMEFPSKTRYSIWVICHLLETVSAL